MRIKTGLPFNQRSATNSRAEYGKLFIVSEGERTEALYFKEIKKQYDVHNQIVILQSSYSNPKKIYDEICDSIDASGFSMTPESIFEEFCSLYGITERSTKYKKFVSMAMKYVAKTGAEWKRDIDDLAVYSFIKELLKLVSAHGFIDQFYAMVKRTQQYNPEMDRIFLVIDRDKKSFTSEQFDYVISESPKKGIEVILTNPCIEFYFLLHYEEVLNLDLELVKKNDYVNKKARRTYVFNQLKLVDKQYKKNKLDAGKYLRKYQTAVDNFRAMGLTSNVLEMKDKVGTNVFDLCSVLFDLK